MAKNDVMDLRRDLGAVRGKMEAINAVSVAEKRDLNEDEQRRWDGLKAEAQFIQRQIDRADQIAGLPGVDNTGAGNADQQSLGGVPAYHSRPTKDNPDAIMMRYIRSRGRDWRAAEEMQAAALEQYRNGDHVQNLEMRQALQEEREQRASNNTGMNITTAADGGNLVPTGHYGRIIARQDEVAISDRLGIMPVPGVGTTVNVPIDDEADGEFVTTGEMGDDNSTNVFDRDAPAVGTVAMTLVKKTKKIELTDELLEDNDVNLMQWIERRVGIGLAKTDNGLIVTAALAGGTAALTLDGAAAITAAEIPELIFAQADGYEDGSAWLMKRATMGYLKGKTGDAFQFVSTPPSSGSNKELWGFPVYNTGSMAAIGAGNKPLVFGNFAYMGVRRAPGLTMLVDPYTVDGKVVLKYYYRVVFKVLQAAAIIYATHPTA
jgi:HK97 family phage major capsid protein